MLTNILGLVMKFLYNLVNNYGIAIILFTLFSKLVLLPVSLLVQKNSIKLVSLKPKINKIKIDNYGNDDMITELESELYKKEKYNPFLSVVPLILQIIILICLVTIVNNPITYISNVDNKTRDKLVSQVEDAKYQELEVIKQVQNNKLDNKELKQLDLTFINFDLTLIAVDIKNYLFPILAALSALIYCFFEMKFNVLQREQSLKYNIITISISVGLSLYLGLFVPTGVALYWIFSNLFAIIQIFVLNFIIPPKKYIDYEELEKTDNELKELSFEDRTKEIIKKEKEDYKRFFKIINKHFVIYSESNSFYKYFKPYMDYILENTNIIIHYITSDYNDNIFELEKKNDNIKAYYIGEKKLISLMMKLDCDVLLMTTPDLDTYHIKRSYLRKDINYIYAPHDQGSTNLTMRKGCTNHFDTVFVTGKHQYDEEIEISKMYNLNRTIFKCGYPLLDDMINSYKKSHTRNEKNIMIAPSWQQDNIIDLCLDKILDELNKTNYRIIVRPHPQAVRYYKQKFEKMKEQYKDSNIIIQTDSSTVDSVFNADILITDWSGIAFEYAFTTLKPVLFIDTPMKIMNPEYKKIDIEPFNIWCRYEIGEVLKVDELDDIIKTVNEMIKNKKKYKDSINNVIKNNVYNLGNSAEKGAEYIIDIIMKNVDRRKKDD